MRQKQICTYWTLLVIASVAIPFTCSIVSDDMMASPNHIKCPKSELIASSNVLPSSHVLEYSNDSIGGTWNGALHVIDKGLGQVGEILVANGDGRQVKTFKHSAGSYQFIDSVQDPGACNYVLTTTAGNYDSDPKLELFLGDDGLIGGGAIYTYEYDNGVIGNQRSNQTIGGSFVGNVERICIDNIDADVFVEVIIGRKDMAVYQWNYVPENYTSEWNQTISVSCSANAIEVADCDNDLLPEIVAPDSTSVKIYEGDHTLKSTIPLPAAGPAAYIPWKCAVGDVLNNDDNQLIVYNGSTCRIYQYNPYSTVFDLVQTTMSQNGIDEAIVADVDSDAIYEFVAAGSGFIDIYENITAYSFPNLEIPVANATAFARKGIQCADMDGDSKNELVALTYANNHHLRIYAVQATIDLIPTVDFTTDVTSASEGTGIKFTFTGSRGDTPAVFLWDFGDGQNSTEENPVHTFSTAGTYTIKLSVMDVDGDRVLLTKSSMITIDVAFKSEDFWSQFFEEVIITIIITIALTAVSSLFKLKKLDIEKYARNANKQGIEPSIVQQISNGLEDLRKSGVKESKIKKIAKLIKKEPAKREVFAKDPHGFLTYMKGK